MERQASYIYLYRFTEKAEKRFDQGDYWWELLACDYCTKFDTQKIIVPTIVPRATYTFDHERFYSNDKTTIISTDDMYLLGVLNTRPLGFFMASIASTKQGESFEYKPMYLERLPIHIIDPSNPNDTARHDRIATLAEPMLDLHKRLAEARINTERNRLQQQIDVTDRQTDKLVYELYGLTNEEIEIVEGSP